MPGDVGTQAICAESVEKTLDEFGHLDILVNNAAEQHPQDCITKISPEQLERTFRTNIFSFFYMTQAALPHLKEGSAIINQFGLSDRHKARWHRLDYSATKCAIVSFTRSLSQAPAAKGIRVNAVALGAIWTPLIPSIFSEEEVQKFGSHVPMKRIGQPEEVAPSYLFLASSESSYMTGQVLHLMGDRGQWEGGLTSLQQGAFTLGFFLVAAEPVGHRIHTCFRTAMETVSPQRSRCESAVEALRNSKAKGSV